MSGKMKNYLGMKKNGFQVIDTTLETNKSGQQKLLVQKITPPDKDWVCVIPASKFTSGELPLSPTEKRKNYVLRRNREIKLKDNKYIVNINFGGGNIRRVFDTRREASKFQKESVNHYVKTGSLPKKKNVAQSKISDHICQRNVGGKPRYIFEFKHGNERCRKSFKFKTDALEFEKAFFKKYDPSKPLPFVQTKNYNLAAHKCIHLCKRTYYFEKNFKGERHRKGFHTLPDALAYRNQWLTDHNLPIPD